MNFLSCTRCAGLGLRVGLTAVDIFSPRFRYVRGADASQISNTPGLARAPNIVRRFLHDRSSFTPEHFLEKDTAIITLGRSVWVLPLSEAL
jgi:hypothetical protein